MDKSNPLHLVTVPGWDQYPWLLHGFSSRAGGLSTVYGGNDLNLGFTREDDPASVTGNRAKILRALAGDQSGDHRVELVTLRQVHGTVVATVSGDAAALQTQEGRALVEADGLASAQPGVLLGIQAADCVPVLVADVKRRVVAGFHAGWRGTAAAIVERGIAQLVRQFGCAPEDILGAIGPSIGACCYTVGEELRTRFAANFPYASDLFRELPDGLHLDLAEANRRQLLAAGLRAENVTVLGECTACTRIDGRRKYFSHRAESGFTGRAMGMIGIAPR